MNLVAIEWVDSSGPSGWTEASAVQNKCERIRSVGWILFESDEVLTIAPHVSYEQEDPPCTGIITIPKQCIVKMRKVKWERMLKGRGIVAK